MAYDWLKGLHIVAVVAWMAGLMMLPRIFVYHMSAEPGSKMDQVFKDAERRLLSIVMTPAMILVLALGVTLVAQHVGGGEGWAFLAHPWLMVKLTFVAFLVGWHLFLMRSRNAFAGGANTRSERFWRMTNELPFLAMIVIVLAVTTKLGG